MDIDENDETTAPIGTASAAGPADAVGVRPARPRTRTRTRLLGATAVVAGMALGGGVVAHASAAAVPAAPAASSSASAASQPAGWPYPPNRRRSSAGSTAALTSATSAQAAGIVDVDVVVGGTQQAAGTGMILTADGEVLTNRHVVEGETAISVTVGATGRTYAAHVVGISTTTDVAVVQLEDASGLPTVTTSSSPVAVGDAVTGVGNAGGAGGTPSAAAGTVTALGRSITASDSDGSNPEQLTGLIETDAAIQPGDSGGPLLDDANRVVGMDTAASSQGNDAYAIPIATALDVAARIEAGGAGTKAGAGTATATSAHGYLGVQVQDSGDGVLVGGVLQGSPAAAAGIVAGDTITAVGGHAVDDIAGLSSVLSTLEPGVHVTIGWTDQAGASHTARVTLVGGQG